MRTLRKQAIALTVLLLAAPVVTAANHPHVRVTNVRRVFHNGEHNAFTDLICWNDEYWLAFRTCPDGHMVHPTSAILVLRSTDLQRWDIALRFSVPKRDVRDPHFLIFDSKLFVYSGTWYCGESSPARSEYTLNTHLGYAAWTSGGDHWHSPVMMDGTYGHYIWRAAAYGNKAFLCGRRYPAFEEMTGEGRQVESVMLESDDGLIWRTRTLFQKDRGDETAFFFEPDGALLAVGRGVSGPARVLRSSSPYVVWTRQDLDRNIGGPLLVRWGERTIVAGRNTHPQSVADRGPKTSFYWLEPDAESTDAILTEFAELPSGGDNSYPGFIELDQTHAVVSWYSSHEKDETGKPITAIYMADLEIGNKLN